MSALFGDLSAKSALTQLRTAQKNTQGNFNDPLFGAVTKGKGGGSAAFFSISSSIKSESAIFKSIGEGLGKAKQTIAAAKAGAGALSGVLDKTDALIAAVEGGAPGGAFSGAIDALQGEAARAITQAGFTGTNLLKEGETLNVALGFNTTTSSYDFRQLSFETQGLTPTDAAQKTETVTRTITEEVQTPITREERIQTRIEQLVERQERIEIREERLTSRLEKLTAREERLTSRLERLTTMESRIEERLVDSGARPTDAKDQRELDRALKTYEKAKQQEASGTKNADKTLARAEKDADKAGLTISLKDLERLEKRQDRIEQRIDRTTTRLEKVQQRQEILTERIQQVQERQEVISERINTFTERLETLSEEVLTQVVGYTTETVERTVTEEVVSQDSRDKAGSFDDLLERVGEKLAAGDAEGAKAIVAEARDRLERVEGQLDQFTGALDRRGGFLGELTKRLDDTVKTDIDEALTDEEAARRAAALLSDRSRFDTLFNGSGRSALLELFGTGGVAEPKETEAAPKDSGKVEETEAA